MMDYTRRQTNPNLALYPLILQVAAVSRYTRHLLLENAHLTAPERYINQLAINNFGFTLQVAWEAVGLSFQLAWLNGGPAALVWGSMIAGIGSTLIAIALGEMASM